MKTTENKTALYQTDFILLSFDKFERNETERIHLYMGLVQNCKLRLVNSFFVHFDLLSHIVGVIGLHYLTNFLVKRASGPCWSSACNSCCRPVCNGDQPYTQPTASLFPDVVASNTHYPGCGGEPDTLLCPPFPALSPQISIIRGVVDIILTHYYVPHSRRCRLKYPLSGV